MIFTIFFIVLSLCIAMLTAYKPFNKILQNSFIRRSNQRIRSFVAFNDGQLIDYNRRDDSFVANDNVNDRKPDPRYTKKGGGDKRPFGNSKRERTIRDYNKVYKSKLETNYGNYDGDHLYGVSSVSCKVMYPYSVNCMTYLHLGTFSITCKET